MPIPGVQVYPHFFLERIPLLLAGHDILELFIVPLAPVELAELLLEIEGLLQLWKLPKE